MIRGHRLAIVGLAVVFATLATPLATAQEHKELGRMWTFENAPLDYFEKAYGFRPTAEWLEHARLSSLRYGNGCSASFVSARGLIMTNHHCARDHIDQSSPEGKDYLTDGFYAGSLEGEVKVDGLTVQQLLSMENVTEQMNAGLEGLTGEARQAKLDENRDAIMKAAGEKHEGMTPQVVSLYQGGMYQLYIYKIYEDVRLVSAPQMQLAKFGGDPDNFTFPRWSLDYTFVRAYEDGKPADTSKHYFKWRTEGPKDGELTFVTGNPGSTGRLDTLAQMEFLRDAMYPYQIANIKGQLRQLRAQSQESEEKRLELRAQILRLENGEKAFTGYLDGLKNENVMNVKRAAEQALRDAISQDPALEARFGPAFAKLEEIAAGRRSALKNLVFYAGIESPAIEAGRLVAQATDPEASADARAAAKSKLADFNTSATAEQTANLARTVSRMTEMVGSDDPVISAILENGTPEKASAWLHTESIVHDKQKLMSLLEGGREAVLASNDPAIRAGLMTSMPDRGAMVARYRSLTADEEIYKKTVGEAFFAVYGTSIAPDATFTLRISDGVVKGFPMNGTIAPPITTLYGLYGRNVSFGNQDPFHLPKNWMDAKDQLDLSTPFCLVSTNDIIGGNSGSPMIDSELRVVGLIFDGNIESLGNRFVFTDDVPRSVSVHPAIIIESLRKVYGAGDLADEIEGKGKGYN